MIKTEWEEPKVEVINFMVCDVIATSDTDPQGYTPLTGFTATIEGE